MTTYRLQRDETLEHGVKRIVDELCEEALGYLGEDDPDEIVEAIHETRKVCKKGRGILRLVGLALGDEYTKTNRLFRDAARELGPIRDPHALTGTFSDLAAVPYLVDDRVARSVRSHLAARAEAATARVLNDENGRIERAARLVESARARADGWDIPDDFHTVGEGVAKTYERGREGMSEAASPGGPETFHEWRKRVKYLWYQMRLLRNSAPSILRPLSNRLHDLSDSLGDAHDLMVLRGVVQESDIEDDHVEVVKTVSEGMRLNLEERALGLGRRLYVEKPSDFVARLEGYWAAWQSGEEMDAGEIADLFPADEDFHQDNHLAELFSISKAGGG